MSEVKVPAIHLALAEVMKELQVDKNGVLPGNMGGKFYLQAHDVSSAVKALFVKHKISFISNERYITEEHIIFKERLSIRVAVAGEYTLTSIEDGSQVIVSGVGDGLATGTAVAANIGSTNALKNALLRTFLITEQAVEEAGMSELKESAEPAKKAPATKKLEEARAKATKSQGEYQKTVMRDWVGKGVISKEDANALYGKVKSEMSELKGDDIFKEMINRLGKGEVG